MSTFRGTKNLIMKTTIKIQNLKCGGCVNTITDKLSQVKNVSDISIDIEDSSVTFDYNSQETLDTVKEILLKTGYPMQGDTNTFGTKAKSYLSCAIGKMN